MSTLVELPRRKCRMCGAVYLERDFHPCNGGSDPFVLEEQSEYHRGYLAGRASGLEESASACEEVARASAGQYGEAAIALEEAAAFIRGKK